jgi:mercuric ion binding protein
MGALNTAIRTALLAFAFPGFALLPSISVAQDSQSAYTFHADGLACPFCAYSIEKQVSKIPGVEKIDIDIKKGVVTVIMATGTRLTEARARKAVEASGFSFRGFEPKTK